MIARVVSGGQSGVDLAALHVARELGIATGGFIPKGWLTEDGPKPELAEFGLVEMPTAAYPPRTRANVRAADATLILNEGELGGGTKLTRDLAKGQCMVLDLDRMDPEDRAWTAHQVRCWLEERGVKTLNVAGPRESKCLGIYERAAAFLRLVLAP
jgi:hypothetical protein